MTVLSVLLWAASLHVQYRIYRAPAEDGGNDRKETEPSAA